MTTRAPIWTVIALLVLLAPGIVRAQAGGRMSFPASMRDPRLAEVLRASESWNGRPGPRRRVVDQVCLVPDAATYYEALATWDDRNFFPILIDDVELTLKFVRAFRPARIVRYPSRAKEVAGEARWDRAVKSVGEAWTAADAGGLRGDETPARLGKTPPGIVLGRASSESLPGLAALAAGRFQPLVRLESTKGYGDLLESAELASFVGAFDAAVRAKVPSFERLGDDCDFVTLAGDFPYRYNGDGGKLAVDDRLGRGGDGERWGFTGRLTGDARRSVYAAMCSLFLQPESALLYNGYPEDADPWRLYSLRPASDLLRKFLPTTLAAGDKATLRGWHDTFDPANRAGLVLINSKGQPDQLTLFGDQLAHAYDIMPSVPAAVCVIHSFSAADPTNPKTVAGRWLEQGAFLYHGSVDEPYLHAFRPLWLVAGLLAEGIPFGAASRQTADEPLGKPWKLTLLGDPLYRLARPGSIPERVRDFPSTAGWPAYATGPRPDSSTPELTRLAWAMNGAIVRESKSSADTPPDEMIATLRSIDRTRLAAEFRPVLDELLAELLFRSGQLGEVVAASDAIPRGERSATVTRLAISASLADLHHALNRGDFRRAGQRWLDLVRLEPDRAFVFQLMTRVGPLATTPARRAEWLGRIRAARAGHESTDLGRFLLDEARKMAAAVQADR